MIPITKPKMTKLEIDYVNDAVSLGWGENCYNYINMFKDDLKKYFNQDDIWLTSSCHGAIHTVLLAIGIGPGDEVIVPDYTWVGTANPVKWLGAQVVGCDVSLDDACISTVDLERKITSKTKVIIAVHPYGNVCDLSEIIKIAKKNDILVIEDCAGAFGSEYNGEKVGTIGDFGVYSFNATKMIVTGEGGAIVARNKKYKKKITLISDQGRDRESVDSYAINTLGLKYNISNIQAALGLAQLQRIEEIKNRKKEIFNLYKTKLDFVSDFIFHNLERKITKNNFWLPTIFFLNKNINLDELVKYVNKNGYNIRRTIYTLSKTEPYKDLGNFPNSLLIAEKSVSLCSFEDITDDQVKDISKLILSFVNKSSLI